jgi:hypothetical protein
MFGETAHDERLRRRMSELIDEEHALERQVAFALEPNRLEDIAGELDRCWDLLCRRNARSAAEPDTDHGLISRFGGSR